MTDLKDTIEKQRTRLRTIFKITEAALFDVHPSERDEWKALGHATEEIRKLLPETVWTEAKVGERIAPYAVKLNRALETLKMVSGHRDPNYVKYMCDRTIKELEGK